MFLFKKKATIKPRYVVRAAEAPPDRYRVVNKWLDYDYYWIVFDSETTNIVYQVQGSDFSSPSRTQAYSHADALNREARAQVTNPYIFDCLTGAKVWEDGNISNVRDRCDALNQEDREMRQRAPEGRWQAIAFALIRAQLKRSPGGWLVRDTGLAIEVRNHEGELVADCENYGDAAGIQALADLEMASPMNFVHSDPDLSPDPPQLKP